MACSAQWSEMSAYRVLVGKPEGKRSLGRPRRRWEDDIKINFWKRGLRGMGLLRIGTSGGLFRTR
jgi:hypothetical protein